MSKTAPDASVSPTSVAGRAAIPVREIWQRLARSGEHRDVFDPEMTDRLPEPAQRWLIHAIRPGTPMARAVVLEMHGRIRIGRWRPFRAVQVQAPPEGFVWAARASVGPIPITGFDRYADATGQMSWRLVGRIPVITAAGADIDLSAAARLAMDAVFVPTRFLGADVSWRAGADSDSAVAEWKVGEHIMPVEMRVGSDGALQSVTMTRWANPTGRPWAYYPFGGTTEDERVFAGITLPTRIRAGYFFGTDEWSEGEFFRATITDATFR